MRRPRHSRHRRNSFAGTAASLCLLTFLAVFQSDIAGTGRPIEVLTRTSPAVQVAAPFPDCRAARAAGAAPVYRGDPGYGEHLDGDLDGIGCEPIYR